MSITERPVSAALKTMLVNNEPFLYAHLIKFERPSRPDSTSGLVSTSKQRYTYLTDASINVSFDDGSTDLQGTANGTQVYLANKVLSVGAVSEQTKATAATTNIVLDGNAIGASIQATVTVVSGGTDLWDITWPNTVDILSEGFREGDKVTLYNSQGTTTQTDDVSLGTFNIVGFRANNVLRVGKIDTSTLSVTNLRMDLASEEIISILLDKNASEYASFINREVYIYRAYFQNGVMKGTPVPIFKGIIYNVGFEDSENAIRVTWGLTSHWGDFAQVRGRITSDEFHRALNENGVPQPLSALKPIYAYDKGFAHSETSINLLATYVVQVEKQKVKYNKGFFGIGSKMKVTKYLEPENRNTNLDFQLNAKNIPLIYGVRSSEGINIFTDTLYNDSSTVYIATALCEGEIGGIYDVYIEGSSLICNDQADYDARASQTTANTVGLICRGRADRGDVLGGTNTIDKASPKLDYFATPAGRDSLINGNYLAEFNSDNYIELTATAAAAPTYAGVLSGESIKLTSPQDIVIDVFSGKSGQKASTALTEIAYAGNFKIQNSYWTGKDTVEYWGPNHRLLDTAYVVTKFKIADGETTIPQLEYIVRGKVLNCYNYDYSYSHDVKSSSESHTNFVLGQTVDLYNSSDVLINSSVQIVDKWTFKNPDGTDNVRFIFSSPPSLGYINGVPSTTKFYMKSGVNKWTMVTYNYVYELTTVASDISSTITLVTNASTFVQFQYASNSFMTIEGDTTKDSPGFQVTTAAFEPVSTGNLFKGAIMEGVVTSTALTSKYLYADYGTEAVSFANSTYRLASRNTIKLTAGSAINDYYVGGIIEVTKYNATTGRSSVQEADIIGYNATNKIVTIDGIWSFIPEAGHTIKIYPKYVDSRVSINPAIQSLDYITSKTYGRGLDYAKDLDLPSWLETARKCDTKSDVTVKTISGTVGVNDVYRYPATGNIIWQGTVMGTSGLYVEFNKVLGKLTNKWNAWKSWAVNEVIYNPDTGQLFSVTTPGVINTVPTATTTAVTLLASFGLTKVSGVGPTNLPLIFTENPVQGLRAGSKISGYSLYDCDDINYFRLTGWDEHAQRYVTKHQCNLTIDTSAPLFDNMNTLLEHYNGILRYTAGKYYLDMEDEEPTIDSGDIRNITIDDIIGKIQLTDEGVRSAYNSLTAAFADPANKFEARSISFFNSDYLKIDRNVSKKGNLSVPGITNYYNTRLLADSFLNKSRYGLTINMTLRYHGLLLLAGTVIQVSYPRYNWVNKKFRIESINYQADGLVDVVAKEYDASFYTLSNIKKGGGTGATSAPNFTAIGAPSNLQISSADTLDELIDGVQLDWTNNPAANTESVATEIYGGQSPNFYVYITSITGNVATTATAHGLVVGMNIYPQVSGSGFSSSSTYYVLTTPTPTTFTVSTTTSIVAPATTPATANLSNGTSLNLKIQTATLLATLPIPISFYIDKVPNAGSNRVEKYYWVRHKVTRS